MGLNRFPKIRTLAKLMRMRISLGLAFTLWCAAAASAAEGVPAGVTVGKYSGWTNCFTLSGGDCKAVVVPNVGVRLLSYTINGESVLLENPELWSQLMRGYSNVWIGGYQCDLGPETR